MGQAAIGSCLGALSAGCCSNLLARDCGDFRASPLWVSQLFDSVFIIAPLAVHVNVQPSSLIRVGLLSYCAAVAAIWLLTATVLLETDRSHYGIKFAVPILVAGTATGIAWYQGWDPHWDLTPFGSVLVGIVVGICLSDLGIALSSLILEFLNTIQNRSYLIVRGLVAAACVVAIGYTLTAMNWVFMCGSCVVIFLSIFEAEKSSQKVSIVSAATTLGGIVVANKCPLWIMICLTTLYNNFILHNPSLEELSLLPLLEDDGSQNDQLARSRTILNLGLLFGTMYCILQSVSGSWFVFSTLATCIWVLIAPRLFLSRIFT